MRPMPALALLGLFILGTVDAIQILKKWRGVANEGEKAVIAVRTGSPMSACEWQHEDDDETYSSRKTSRGLEVSLKDEDTLCVLEVDRVDRRDHGGFWTVVVYGESCAKDRKRREAQEAQEAAAANVAEARTVTVSHQSLKPGSSVTISHRGRSKTRTGPKAHRTKEQKAQYEVVYNRRRNNKSDRNRGSSGNQLNDPIDEKIHACGDYDIDGDVEIVVARDGDDVVAVAAQDEVFSEAGDELVVTVRTNAEPDNCVVYFEDEKVVELNRGNDNCNTRFENSKVCLENYVKPQEGIFSCIAKIDSFNRRLEGRWEIEIIKKVVRTDEVKELATIDATLIELPSEVYLVYDGDKLKPRDNINPRDPGPIKVNCEVIGGSPRPELRLYTGNIPGRVNEATERRCRETVGRDRDTTCSSFEFTPKKTHRTEGEITCVAVVPGVDSFKSDKLTASADLRINEYVATLKGSSGDAVTICDPDARVGSEFLIEVEFEADPDPEIVEWTMQVNEGGTTDPIEAGYSEGDYTTYEIEEKRRGIFVASLRIERLSQYDLDVPQNHELLVENEVGTSVFRISIDTSDECEEHISDRRRTPRDSERRTKKQRKSSRQRSRKYECDVKDDDDCRCDDPDRPRECCDASRNCRRNCCERCDGGTTRKSRKCNLCDDREKKCMKLKDDRSRGGDNACEDGDRDCVCVDYENDDGDDEEFCCIDKSSASRDDRCKKCDEDDDDEFCFCKGRGRNKECVEVPEELVEGDDRGSSRNTKCRSSRDKDCICVEYENEDGDDEEYCCSDKSGCRGRDCCDTCRKNDDDCYCDGRDCVTVPERLIGSGGSSKIGDKLKDAMLEGCVEMAATLLDHYEADGSKRRGSKSDRDIESDLEDFFEGASCTGYDRDIQDYFKDKDRKRDRNKRRSVLKGSGGVVGFSSANPGNKVQRVTGLSALSGGVGAVGQKELSADYDPDLVGFASDVANINARLDRGG